MVRQSTQARLDALVAAFTELGPAWGHWTSACTPTTSVSYIRMRLLHALAGGGGQPMTALARALGVTQRRVTDLFEAVGADQLVDRRPNPKDGRSTVVSLTKAGADQLKLSWQQHQTDIGKVFGDLPPEQQKQLLEITPVLTEAIRKRTAARSSADAYPQPNGRWSVGWPLTASRRQAAAATAGSAFGGPASERTRHAASSQVQQVRRSRCAAGRGGGPAGPGPRAVPAPGQGDRHHPRRAIHPRRRPARGLPGGLPLRAGLRPGRRHRKGRPGRGPVGRRGRSCR